MLQIDVSILDEKQLTALALIDPDAVRKELIRRKAFATPEDAITALRQSHLELSALLEGLKDRRWVSALRKTNIISVIDRLLVTDGFPKGQAPSIPVFPDAN